MSRAPVRSIILAKKQGFFTIEVIIGLALLTLFALGMGGYFHIIAHLESEGLNRLRGLSIARTAMEHVCAGNESLIHREQDRFTVEWELLPATPHGYSRAHVHVSWKPLKGEIQTINLESGVWHEHA